jgi:hypothetical protein
MGLIICTEPGKDEFVYWSTIADGPMGFGTREELQRQIRRLKGSSGGEADDERFDRAAELGSSMKAEAEYCEGHWDDSGFVYNQQGWLPRDRMGAFMRLYNEDRLDEAIALLDSLDT